jgi:hypothetical protein
MISSNEYAQKTYSEEYKDNDVVAEQDWIIFHGMLEYYKEQYTNSLNDESRDYDHVKNKHTIPFLIAADKRDRERDEITAARKRRQQEGFVYNKWEAK